jgi:hypothetical protein
VKLPSYDPTGRCPKCNGEDVATRYVEQGGKYGEPCEFYSADVRDTEHMHRHCRRCSFEWCEACVQQDDEKIKRAVDVDRRHSYCMAESYLSDAPLDATPER